MRLKTLAVTFLVIAIVSLAPWTFSAEIQSTDTQANPATALLTPEHLNADLDFLVKTIGDVHPNMYAYTTKEEFASRLADVRSHLDKPLNRNDFYELVVPLVASLHSAHTAIKPYLDGFYWRMNHGGKAYPLDLYWDSQAVRVGKVYRSAPLPQDARILKINGEDAAEVLTRLWMPLGSEGTQTRTGFTEPGLMGGGFLLWRLWHEYGEDRPLVVTIAGADGNLKEMRIDARPCEFGTDDEKKQSASAKKSADGVRASNDGLFSFRHIDEYKAGYMRLGTFGIEHKKELRRFVDDVFATVKTKKASWLIVDVRNNRGGNGTLGDLVIDYLSDKPWRQAEAGGIKVSQQQIDGSSAPDRAALLRKARIGAVYTFGLEDLPFDKPSHNRRRFHGRVIVLMNSNTFSMGMSFANTVKYFGLGTLVGEETLDTLVHYTTVYTFRLPNTGFEAYVPRTKVVQVGGKEDGRGVIPDYEVHQTPEDTAKGKDTALEFVLNLISSGADKPALNSTQ